MTITSWLRVARTEIGSTCQVSVSGPRHSCQSSVSRCNVLALWPSLPLSHLLAFHRRDQLCAYTARWTAFCESVIDHMAFSG